MVVSTWIEVKLHPEAIGNRTSDQHLQKRHVDLPMRVNICVGIRDVPVSKFRLSVLRRTGSLSRHGLIRANAFRSLEY